MRQKFFGFVVGFLFSPFWFAGYFVRLPYAMFMLGNQQCMRDNKKMLRGE